VNSKLLWVVVPLVVICLAGVFYLSEKLWESESWLRKDAFVVYEQFFVWNGESTVEYMVWNVTDLRDGIVDLKDFADFSGRWRTQDILLAQDLDRDGTVDLQDIAVFAQNWLWQQ